MKKITKLIALMLLIQASAFAAGSFEETISDLPGLKYPDAKSDEDGDPVLTYAPYKRLGDLSGFTDLIPYIVPSPNQEGAGSCLYMSHTGIAEWWKAFLDSKAYPEVEGEYDFSERFTMNLAKEKKYREDFKNWRTDTIYLFNRAKKAMLNSSYPFTKGWYKYNEKGEKVKAKKEDEGSKYGSEYNWISDLETVVNDKGVNLPKFERDIIYSDPDENQWNVGITPKDIVQKVKDALKINRSPVMVMYNHYGYWHIHIVVGYDDEQETDCSFTENTGPYLAKKAEKYAAQAKEETDPKKKKKLERKSKSYARNAKTVKDTFKEIGECSGKGAFYVRDSLYSDPKLPNYSFYTNDTQDDRRYTKKVIFREYEYLRVLANHVFQIRPVDAKWLK